MRKRTGKRKLYGITPKAPMLVLRTLKETEWEVLERSAISALSYGVASRKHFQLLEDVINLMVVATDQPNKAQYKPKIQAWVETMESIRRRHDNTGKYGVSGVERNTLIDMINFHGWFWKRQTAELYIFCDAEVRAFYAAINKERQND